jgi:outer membrane protein W
MAITWDKQPASRQGATQNVAFNAAGGASTQSTTLGSQTYQVRIAVSGTGFVAGTGGVRLSIGDNPTATATSMFQPNIAVEYYTTTPGQNVAVLGNDAGTGTISVAEFS